MSASPLLQEVYHAHVEHFGEPEHSWSFEDGKALEGYPDCIDVMLWRPSEECELTTFATIGMADKPMKGAAHRAELHFAIRRQLERPQEADIALFLANLAMYPFQLGAPLDWWQTIADAGDLPLYTEARCMLLHPAFVPDGWSKIATSAGEVRILNVVPITQAERALRSRAKIEEALAEVDVFSPR